MPGSAVELARFKFGAALSAVLLIATVLVVSNTQSVAREPTILMQSKLNAIAALLQNSTASAQMGCMRPQLSNIVLVHGSSWNSFYSFEDGKELIDESLGHVLLTGGSDVEWKNGTNVVSSARQRYHPSAKASKMSAKHSFSSTAVWQVLDCEGNVLAAIKSTEFHRCQEMALLDFADCHWESTNFSVHDKGGDHVGSLQLRRHHEFDVLELSNEKGDQHIASIQAIAAKLSTIEATVGEAAQLTVPADARVLAALMVKVHQQVVRVENRAAVNSVAMPILGFCALYLLFSACALLGHIGGARIQGALYVNTVVVAAVAVTTVIVKATLSPAE